MVLCFPVYRRRQGETIVPSFSFLLTLVDPTRCSKRIGDFEQVAIRIAKIERHKRLCSIARKGVEVRPPDSLMVNVESLHEQEYEVCHEPAERV